MDFETIGLSGKYKELMGDPAVGFSAMVYGLPKSGKSTFCLGFAHHLAAHHGNVLYCAVEEGFGYTLKEKIERLYAAHPRLFIAGQLPDTLEGFDFVFIDSVSKAGLDLHTLQEVREDYPRTSFIFIYHTTKAGNFRGENAHAHEVDVIVQVAADEITANGRFASGGKVKMEDIVSC
jgi:predicted ATP-dependent serine protease